MKASPKAVVSTLAVAALIVSPTMVPPPGISLSSPDTAARPRIVAAEPDSHLWSVP